MIAMLIGLSACASHPRYAIPRSPASPEAAVRYPPDLPRGWSGACNEPPGARQAAKLNAGSIDTLPVSPFGHIETGWRAYAPLTAFEVGARCPADTAGFAEALARWKTAHGLAYDGAMDAQTLFLLKGAWQERRPFLMARVRKEPCPDPPNSDDLVQIRPEESHYGRPIFVRREVLDAYRQMVLAARRDLPELAADPTLLTIFSGFRSPEYDQAQCAQQGGCNGVSRAGGCSDHRTGAAIDIVIGAAPGARVDTASDANRTFLSETRLYQWLVFNAGRFGFVNYPFEPWHWEWAGAAD
jgi:LAS superfamily LD-carboxypeptidase LdcB